MLWAGSDVRTVQKLMGHRHVRPTMIYIEAVTDAGPYGVCPAVSSVGLELSEAPVWPSFVAFFALSSVPQAI